MLGVAPENVALGLGGGQPDLGMGEGSEEGGEGEEVKGRRQGGGRSVNVRMWVSLGQGVRVELKSRARGC